MAGESVAEILSILPMDLKKIDPASFVLTKAAAPL